MSDAAFEHTPVLVDAVLEHLAPQAGDVVLDATVGLGGHALAILPRIRPGGKYVGLDVDPQMLAHAEARLDAEPGEVDVILAHANYVEFPRVLAERGIGGVDCVLADLGVNSAQLADAARGFSFDREGPLDMRFDPGQKRSALDLVNQLSETELSDLFYEYGQEGKARKIAKQICKQRRAQRITTTMMLARAVEAAYEGRTGKTHPATRVFQALRIAVNQELDNLREFLEQVVQHLNPGGRLAVISFHSLEDGAVKRFIRSRKATGELEEINKRPIVAEGAERRANPRSRSAKLRAARRMAG